MKILKNIYLIIVSLIILPFAMMVFICSIPFLIHSSIIDMTRFKFTEDDAWDITSALEYAINFFVSPFTK